MDEEVLLNQEVIAKPLGPRASRPPVGRQAGIFQEFAGGTPAVPCQTGQTGDPPAYPAKPEVLQLPHVTD